MYGVLYYVVHYSEYEKEDQMLINKNSSEPVYVQVINQYKKEIATGVLKPHNKLPSVRKLSYDIGINPNTLQKAFTNLESSGVCYSLPGKGRFVSEDAVTIINSDANSHFAALDKTIEYLAMCNIDIDEIISKVRESYKKAESERNKND